jgi:succinyl-CoA synthetase alpha subunit
MNPLSLLNSEAPMILQGITGKQGSLQVQRLRGSGTRLVAGVAPGHGGEVVEGAPVFSTVNEAVSKTAAKITMILVPPAAAEAAVTEAIDADVQVIVLITEHIATQTTLDLIEHARNRGICLIGPNTAGVIRPGSIKIGIMAQEMYQQGRIALLSRSGTLMSEVAHQLTQCGLGQSTCIDIGGDLIVGVDFIEAMEWLRDDVQTDAIAVLGEIGGAQEEKVAAFLHKRSFPKPIYGLVVGHHAPQGKRMGHAGALVNGVSMTAAAKTQKLKEAGVSTANHVDELVQLICQHFRTTAVNSGGNAMVASRGPVR